MIVYHHSLQAICAMLFGRLRRRNWLKSARAWKKIKGNFVEAVKIIRERNFGTVELKTTTQPLTTAVASAKNSETRTLMILQFFFVWDNQYIPIQNAWCNLRPIQNYR